MELDHPPTTPANANGPNRQVMNVAFRNIVDEMLKIQQPGFSAAEQQEILQGMRDMRLFMNETRVAIADLQTNVAGLQTNLANFQVETRAALAELRTGVAELRADVAELRTDLNDLQAETHESIAELRRAQAETHESIAELRRAQAETHESLTELRTSIDNSRRAQANNTAAIIHNSKCATHDDLKPLVSPATNNPIPNFPRSSDYIRRYTGAMVDPILGALEVNVPENTLVDDRKRLLAHAIGCMDPIPPAQ